MLEENKVKDKKMIRIAKKLNKRLYDNNIENVAKLNEWEETMYKHFDEIEIKQCKENYNDITIDAGNKIQVGCEVTIPEQFIDIKNIQAEVYYGKITSDGIVNDIQITPMEYEGLTDEKTHRFIAKIELRTGGDYGYTFRVIPKNEMILNPMNLDLIKWITD